MVAAQLLPTIYRFNNQQFFSSAVGVYAIELPDTILLIDVPAYTKETASFLRSFGKPTCCILTHGPTGIADTVKWQKLGVTVYMHQADVDDQWLQCTPDVLFNNTPIIADDIEIIVTPGHKPGAVCIFHKSSRSLFSGDTIGGVNGGIKNMRSDPHDDNNSLRIQSCHSLLQYKFEHILPFHYQPIMEFGKQKLNEYLIS